MKKAYVALGGNLNDPLSILKQSVEVLKANPAIFDFNVSRFYQTTPVSDIPQSLYVNAVCSFMTAMSSFELLNLLQKIEQDFGKTPKPKNAPRILDLDILFFGNETLKTDNLTIPHPLWQERLFVLKPLFDLTHEIEITLNGEVVKKNIKSLLNEFVNPYNEKVIPL